MTTMQLPGGLIGVEATITPAIEIVIPVHNEEHDLEPSVRRLHAYLTTTFPLSFRITIADNASTDNTWAIAGALEAALPNVHAIGNCDVLGLASDPARTSVTGVRARVEGKPE